MHRKSLFRINLEDGILRHDSISAINICATSSILAVPDLTIRYNYDTHITVTVASFFPLSPPWSYRRKATFASLWDFLVCIIRTIYCVLCTIAVWLFAPFWVCAQSGIVTRQVLVKDHPYLHSMYICIDDIDDTGHIVLQCALKTVS